jgi:hypothetical protein
MRKGYSSPLLVEYGAFDEMVRSGIFAGTWSDVVVGVPFGSIALISSLF